MDPDIDAFLLQRKTYFDFCAKYDSEPIPSIMESFEGMSSNKDFLDINGKNTDPNSLKLPDAQLSAIMSTLKQDNYITRVNVSYNSLSDKNCIILSKVIFNNTWLRHLVISMCGISTEGCMYIAKALETNVRLLSLDISGNAFGRQGLYSLASALQVNNTLRLLNVAHTDQTNVSIIPLLTLLKRNETLFNVDFSRTIGTVENIGDHISDCLMSHCRLKRLMLQRISLNDEECHKLCQGLKYNKRLRHLDLSANKLSCDGATQLSLALTHNTCLKEIVLCCNDIRDRGVIALAEVLACSNNTLCKLWLNNNAASGEGLSSLASALETNTAITHVFIWGNKLDNRTCNAFANICGTENSRIYKDNIDVKPYVVDGINYLSELGHYNCSH